MAFITRDHQNRRRGSHRTTNPNQSRGFRPPAAPNKPKPNLGAKAAPPKAAPPKPVGRSAQPDSAYNTRVDIAERQGEERLSQLQGQEQAIKHDFGIEDPTNPFSRAEGLKRMFLAKYRGQSAGIAAQGHLYSGQHERALARTRREEEEARANLRSNYEQAIGAIGAAKAGVRFDTEEQRAQAFEDWLARAPESEAPVADLADAAAPVTPMPTRSAGKGTMAEVGAATRAVNFGAAKPLAGKPNNSTRAGSAFDTKAKLKAAQKRMEEERRRAAQRSRGGNRSGGGRR